MNIALSALDSGYWNSLCQTSEEFEILYPEDKISFIGEKLIPNELILFAEQDLWASGPKFEFPKGYIMYGVNLSETRLEETICHLAKSLGADSATYAVRPIRPDFIPHKTYHYQIKSTVHRWTEFPHPRWSVSALIFLFKSKMLGAL